MMKRIVVVASMIAICAPLGAQWLYGAIPSWAGDVVGLWKVTPPSSTDPRYSGERLTVRFELHGKGEVFTLNRVR